MGLCCSKSRTSRSSQPDRKNISRYVTLRPEQPNQTSTDERLLSLDPKDVLDVPHKGEHIRVRIIKVYDGDTVKFIFLHGGQFPLKFRMRIVNIDAPEIKGAGISTLHSESGKAVRDVVEKLTNNKILWARIDKWDKYGGRVDGEIFISPSTERIQYNNMTDYGIPLSSWLLQEELAHPYSGKQARDEWNDEEFRSIIEKANLINSRL